MEKPFLITLMILLTVFTLILMLYPILDTLRTLRRIDRNVKRVQTFTKLIVLNNPKMDKTEIKSIIMEYVESEYDTEYLIQALKAGLTLEALNNTKNYTTKELEVIEALSNRKDFYILADEYYHQIMSQDLIIDLTLTIWEKNGMPISSKYLKLKDRLYIK